MKNMYTINSLAFAYPNSPRILSGVDFELTGGLTFLLGGNGSGKSTLLKLMLAQLKPCAGEIRLLDKPVGEYSPRKRAVLVSYVPQSYSMQFNYTALEMVAMGRTPHISPFVSISTHDFELAKSAMARLGIERLADKGFLELSGGERRLCIIARALVGSSRIILMDEPTAELDYGNRYMVLETIRSLTDCTVLLSSHDPEAAQAFADRVIALKAGQIAFDGTPHEVLTADAVESLYGRHARHGRFAQR